MSTDTLNAIEGIVRDLLIFVGAMVALLIVLIIVVSLLPPTNPLKRILTALSYRVGATAAAGALAIPVEPIPGLDVAYDIGVPIFLIWYWYRFFRDLGYMWTEQRRPQEIEGNGIRD
jgi:hypothetical protein